MAEKFTPINIADEFTTRYAWPLPLDKSKWTETSKTYSAGNNGPVDLNYVSTDGREVLVERERTNKHASAAPHGFDEWKAYEVEVA